MTEETLTTAKLKATVQVLENLRDVVCEDDTDIGIVNYVYNMVLENEEELRELV